MQTNPLDTVSDLIKIINQQRNIIDELEKDGLFGVQRDIINAYRIIEDEIDTKIEEAKIFLSLFGRQK